MDTLTDRIRVARKRAGLSQTDIAKALRISPAAVNHWEQGFSKNIKLEHFFALASLLKQDPQWLATGKMLPRVRKATAMPLKPDDPSLSREERALLHHVRQMPNSLRKLLLRFARGLNNICASNDKQTIER